MHTFLAIVTFLCASFYVFFLDYLSVSPQALQKSLVLPLIILIFAFYLFAKHSWKALFTNPWKWFLLFETTILVQLLVVSTGGFQSPFLILLYLTMIALSFIFSFFISLSFLGISLLTLGIMLVAEPELFMTAVADPGTLILQFTSLVVIIPIAYIVSLKYHTKDLLFGLLREKVTADEAIFQALHEMIIVTDTNLRILSVNNAVEKTLQKSQAELLDQKLFDVLLLRDSKGKLMKSIPQQTTETFTLLASATSQKKVTITIQTLPYTDTKNNQISFVLRDATAVQPTQMITIDEARAKYHALVQNIKKELIDANVPIIEKNVQLLEKIEADTYYFLAHDTTPTTPTRIDMAKLCKQIVIRNESFAKAFSVHLAFSLPHFGMKDIEPLTIKEYPVKPEQLTGPFFTVMCDVEQVEIALTKLLDLGIFLASSEQQATVFLMVEREKNDIIVSLEATCPDIQKKELSALFEPYYKSLAEKTNLHFGSGLEGYMLKHITEKLTLPLEITIEGKANEKKLMCSISFPKKGKSL